MLKTAGESQTTISPPATVNIVARNGQVPVCVQIMRGRFYANAADYDIARAASWGTPMQLDATAIGRLGTVAGFYPADRPDFLFEGYLARAEGTEAVTLVPRYVALNRPMERPTLSFDDTRHLALAFDLFGPNITSSAQPVASAALVLGRLGSGAVLCLPPQDGEARSPGGSCRAIATPTPTPGAPPSPPGGFGSFGNVPAPGQAPQPQAALPVAINWRSPNLFEATWFTLPVASQTAAYSLRAVVTETRQGSDFAAFLGRSFDASKAGLTTALTDAAQNAVSQERRDTVATETAARRRTALTAHNTALTAAIAKLSDCAAATNAVPLSQAAREARLAQQEVNDRTIGLGNGAFRFSSLVPTEATESTRSACSDARDAATGGKG
jgi:hypothetical protein